MFCGVLSSPAKLIPQLWASPPNWLLGSRVRSRSPTPFEPLLRCSRQPNLLLSTEKIMTYQKILVALDRTDASDRVFDHALGMARSSQGQLQLVHSINVSAYDNLGKLIDAGAGLQNSAKVQHEEEAAQLQLVQETQQWLEQLRTEALNRNIAADFVCKMADPGPFICQLAETWNADMIVMGNSGKKGLKKLVLGSVSDYVAKHAPCPTTVVPNDSSLDVQLLSKAS
ncbi:universal stress protein [filamentous cyanobacterium CCP3]|nr:universal stress protein [filamentous cyanobacterium CCP3]